MRLTLLSFEWLPEESIPLVVDEGKKKTFSASYYFDFSKMADRRENSSCG